MLGTVQYPILVVCAIILELCHYAAAGSGRLCTMSILLVDKGVSWSADHPMENTRLSCGFCIT